MSRSIVPADGLHQPSRPTPPAADLIAPIHAAHEAFIAAAGSAVQYAIEAGRLLNAAKAQVGHGNWLAWFQANCQFTARMAQNYMRTAKNETRFALGEPESLRQALTLLAKPKVDHTVLAQLEAHDPDLAWNAEMGQIKVSRAASKVRQSQRQAEEQKRIAERAIDPDLERVRLHLGRFQDADVADWSLDWIITDPPYGVDYVGLYGEFSEWAARKLKPGGSALVMFSHSGLKQTLPALWSALDYVWMIALKFEPGTPCAKVWSPARLLCSWKPIVWLSRGRPDIDIQLVDSYANKGKEGDKDDHEWQQGQEFFDWLIRTFTRVGQLVCDPFMGTGTTGVSCRNYDRDFIGIERDKERFEISRSKILGREGPARDRAPDLARTGVPS